MKRFFITLTILLFSFVQVFAQEALIVKQEGRKVYLDISEFTEKPKVLDSFSISFLGEEIVNPKTGKSLGKKVDRRLSGTISIVENLYAVGELNDEITEQDKLEGLDAEIKVTPSPAIVEQKAPLSEDRSVQPIWQSKPIEGKATAFTTADIDGNGQNKLVLAFDNIIKVYDLKDSALKEISSFEISSLNEIITLDSADLDNDKKAEIFISVFDNSQSRFSTLIYGTKDKEFVKKDTIKGLVKGIAPYNTKRVLYTQKVSQVNGNVRALTPRILTYKNGKYEEGEALNVYKFHSIFGFNMGYFKQDDNKTQNVIYTQDSGKLRLQFNKNSAYLNSPDDFNFASTPTRIKVNNDIYKVYSSIALFNSAENGTIIAGIENEAKLGILSSTFGSYQRGKLVFLRWTGSALETQSKTDLGGYAVDLMQGSLGTYKDVLIVPFMTDADQTTINIFPTK